MHRWPYGFRTKVNTVQRLIGMLFSYWHFSFVVKLICSWRTVRPSYIHENAAEIQTSTQIRPIGGRMATRRLLSPSSTLPQPSSHCAFIPAKKNSALVTERQLFDFFLTFFKLHLRRSEIVTRFTGMASSMRTGLKNKLPTRWIISLVRK